jgi:hypothetical protein
MGATEKVQQFIMPLKSICRKKPFVLKEQKRIAEYHRTTKIINNLYYYGFCVLKTCVYLLRVLFCEPFHLLHNECSSKKVFKYRIAGVYRLPGHARVIQGL